MQYSNLIFLQPYARQCEVQVAVAASRHMTPVQTQQVKGWCSVEIYKLSEVVENAKSAVALESHCVTPRLLADFDRFSNIALSIPHYNAYGPYNI